MRPTAGKAALRPAQKARRSSSEPLTRKVVAPAARAIPSMRRAAAVTSASGPSVSMISSASASVGYPAPTKASAARMAGPSIISMPAGMMPAAMTSPTQRAASSTAPNPARKATAVAGRLRMRTVTSVTMPSSPSEPVRAPNRSSPGASNALPPRRTTSPPINTTSSPSTLLVVRPYFRQCTPPEFSATLPPMVQAIWLEGSGA